jgi:hypothetical protein
MPVIVNRKLEEHVCDLAENGKGYEALAGGLFLVLEDIADSLRRIADHMDRRGR